MKIFQKAMGRPVRALGEGAGKAAKKAGNLVARKYPWTGNFLGDTGQALLKGTGSTLYSLTQFADGTVGWVSGAIRKDRDSRISAGEDLKEPVVRIVNATIKTVGFTGRSAGSVIAGTVRKDQAQVLRGATDLGKVAVVVLAGAGAADWVISAEAADADMVEYRNTSLDHAGFHEVTEIPYEDKVIEYEGKIYAADYPVFPALFEAEVPEDAYLLSDHAHFRIANMQLQEALQANPEWGADAGLSGDAGSRLNSGEAPDGFVWHHHEEPGRMQLVPEDIHASSGHIGGRSIWGGDSGYR